MTSTSKKRNQLPEYPYLFQIIQSFVDNIKTFIAVTPIILAMILSQLTTNVSAQVVITTTTTNATCATSCDGALDLKISGGVEPYTYAWSSTGSTGYKQITLCLTGPPGATNQTATGTCNPPAPIADAAVNLCPGTYSVTVTDANGTTATTIQTIGTQPPNILAVVTDATTTTCVSSCTGTIKVNASGGNAPYTYSWSSTTGVTGNVINGLCPGTYSVTVTDKGGCDSILTYTIGPTPTPTITGSPMCSGGTAILTASGGSTYTWSTGPTGPTISVNPVVTTTYTVTVNSSGCATSTTAFTLTVNPAVTAPITPTNVTCNGTATGSSIVNPAGGTSPFTYLWTNNQTTQTATNLTIGGYTVTVTDIKGCTNTAAVAITEPSAITVTSSQTSSACLGSSGSAVATANGGTGTLTYSWIGYASGQTISGVPASAYTVVVTDGNGCTKTDVITINDTPKPNIDNLTGTPTLCKGNNNGTATVAASGGSGTLTYSWSNGGSGITGVTGLIAGIYIVTVTDGAGCKAINTVTITEPDAISVVSSVINSNCGKPDGSASVTPVGGTGAYTYSWTPSGGTGQTASGLTAAGGPYTVAVTDANGCSTTTSATIGTQTPGVASILQTDIKCNGGNNGVAVATITGATAASYTWAPSGGNGQTASNLSPGPYTVTITDTNGCTSTSTTSITEPSSVTATTTSTDAICTAPNGSATVNNPTGGTGPYVYLWSNSTTLQTAVGLTAAGGPYTVTVTDANGCKISTTVTVGSVNGSGTATISQSNIICNGESNGILTVNTSAGTSPFTYTWSSTGIGQTESNLPIGSYTVTITDANGCIITSSATITEPSAISSPTITSTQASCGQSNGSAIATASGGNGTLTYSWSNLTTGATASNLVANLYTVTVTDANGCTKSAITNITDTGGPSVALNQTDILCNGESTGVATATISWGSSPYTYLWSGGSLAVTTSLTLTANALTANTYTLTINDANNCQVISIVTITEPPAISVPTITSSNPTCGQSNGSVIASASGGTGTLTYIWSNSTVGATATNLTVGTYTVTVSNDNGCSKTSTVTLTQPAPLSITSLVRNATCGSSNGSIIGVITGGSPTYIFNWSNGGSSITSSIIDSLYNLTAGNYSVTITDANGCTATNTATIGNVSSAILSVIPAQQTISQGGSVAITVVGGVSYTWSPAAGLSCTDCANPTATPIITTTYTVIATDANGCTVTAMMTVTVKKACEDESDVYVANVFSPNNDGKNDVLYVEGNGLTNIYWAIYDRWGNLLFEAFDQSHGWDGARKGNPMETGTYVYYLKATCLKTNSEVKLKGNVSIIK